MDCLRESDQRVNSWLDKLAAPADSDLVDVTGALAYVLSRAETPRLFATDTGVGQGTNPRALASSLIFQCAMVAILMLIGTNDAMRTKMARIALIAPLPAVKHVQPKTNLGGGGGQHSPLPPLKGQLPKPALRVFTTPLVTIEHPALVMDTSLIAPPDAWAAPIGVIGNPLAAIGGAGGPGGRGGIGPGDGIGVGGSNGPGVGDLGIFSVGNGTTSPTLLSKVDPEYSEEARKAKYSGAVTLSIVVNTDGTADSIRVVKSLGMGLDEKAIEAVQRWRFKPGTNKGAPVRVRAQVEVNFRLL